VLISSSYQPVGKVERVDGGFRLSGRWGFSSGCEHCDWVFLGSIVPPVPGETGPPDMRTFLLPRKDYQIVRDWDVLGLQATGSHGIVVDKAFVPEYRTHRAADGFHGTNPGLAVNDGPLYRLPWAQLFVRVISTGSIGAAQAALDTYYELAARRVSTNTGRSAKMDPIALNTAARAQASIDEMRTLLFHNFDVMMDTIRAGRTISYADRVRYRYESAQVARRCAAIADDLMLMLGGWAIYNTSPMVQWWLDLNAARAHVASDPNLIGSSLGAICLGQEVHEAFV
jgi:3-hydroxy-9,10-secoandrosta-1,3,5(10)-triene-9,17-dione monooxygenase